MKSLNGKYVFDQELIVLKRTNRINIQAGQEIILNRIIKCEIFMNIRAVPNIYFKIAISQSSQIYV